MKIEFEGKKLAKNCADEKSRLAAYGRDRAKKLGLRLSTVQAAPNLEGLRQAPGRFHELTGDRKGYFAASLDEPYRLIFRPVLAPGVVPGTDWSHITHVLITEIVDYHG